VPHADRDSHPGVALEQVDCTSCGSPNHHEMAQLSPWGVRRCLRCSMLFVSPRPPAEMTTALYDEQYFDGTGEYGNRSEDGGYQASATGYHARARQLVRWITSLTRVSTGRWLDIGCGPGYLVAAASEMGFSGTGVDISAAAVRYGVDVLGVRLCQGSAEQVARVVDPPFTVVTMVDTLFHLRDPHSVLKQVWSLLAPAGYLFAGPFDLVSDGRPALLLQEAPDIRQLGIPEHLSFVNQTSMSYLLGDLGFAHPCFMPMPLTPSDLTERSVPLLPRSLMPVIRRIVRRLPLIQRAAHALASRSVNPLAGYVLAQKPGLPDH
jgi:SAM-dependent methyltransferase